MIDAESIRSMIETMTRICAKTYEASQAALLPVLLPSNGEGDPQEQERAVWLSDAADDAFEGATGCLDALRRVLELCGEVASHD